ncbi:VanZ family protein [Viscerimonas tarda]
MIPNKDIPEVEFNFFVPADKLVHYLMYLGLSGAAALYYIYDKKGHIHLSAMLFGAIIVPILYGGLIEIIQEKYFPPRSGDWFDFLADTLGALTALVISLCYRRFLLRKQVI